MYARSVTTMEEKQKDRELEREFREYFDGLEAPRCDLSYAKRALSAPKRKPRKWVAAIVSACASAAVFLLCCILIPYSVRRSRTCTLADTTQQTVSAEAVREEYSSAIKPFAGFEQADNASCSYSLVTHGGKTVLVRADISFYSPQVRFNATAYIDVSSGKYRVKDFDEYSDFKRKAYGFFYDTAIEEETGSSLSRIYGKGDRRDPHYYIAMLSDQPQALDYLLSYLDKFL